MFFSQLNVGTDRLCVRVLRKRQLRFVVMKVSACCLMLTLLLLLVTDGHHSASSRRAMHTALSACLVVLSK